MKGIERCFAPVLVVRIRRERGRADVYWRWWWRVVALGTMGFGG